MKKKKISLRVEFDTNPAPMHFANTVEIEYESSQELEIEANKAAAEWYDEVMRDHGSYILKKISQHYWVTDEDYENNPLLP